MKKLIALIAAAACMALAGCSGEKDAGGTGLESTVGGSEAVTEGIAPEKTEEAGGSSVTEETQQPPEETPETAPTPETGGDASSESSEPAPDTNYSALVSAFGNSYLGLPSEEKVYIFSDNGNSAEINGGTYYGVSCYDEYDGTLYYMCDFYVSADGSEVYRRYEQEDRYALLPEVQGFARLDPTRQSPEEIFAAADGLYMMFDPDSNSAVGGFDESSPQEFNGVVYYPVTNELLDTKAELMDALTKYFTADIINSLMSTEKFTDIDGRLYVKACSGGTVSPNYSGTEYELTTLTEDTAVFTRYDTYNFEAGETSEVETVYTAKKEFGVWRFTDYPSAW